MALESTVVNFRDVEIATGGTAALPTPADGIYEPYRLDDVLSRKTPSFPVANMRANLVSWSVLAPRLFGPGGRVSAFR